MAWYDIQISNGRQLVNLPTANQRTSRIQVTGARWNIRRILMNTLVAGIRGTNGT